VPLLLAQLTWGAAQYWVVALGLVAGGELLRVWAAGHISRRYRTLGSDVGPLVCSGPYSRVRNPLYLGNLLQWTGLGCLSGLKWAVAWLVLGGILYATIVSWEEKQLAAAWPDDFEKWSQRVNRWLPTWRTDSPGMEMAPKQWNGWEAIRSERSTLVVWILVGTVFALV